MLYYDAAPAPLLFFRHAAAAFAAMLISMMPALYTLCLFFR